MRASSPAARAVTSASCAAACCSCSVSCFRKASSSACRAGTCSEGAAGSACSACHASRAASNALRCCARAVAAVTRQCVDIQTGGRHADNQYNVPSSACRRASAAARRSAARARSPAATSACSAATCACSVWLLSDWAAAVLDARSSVPAKSQDVPVVNMHRHVVRHVATPPADALRVCRGVMPVGGGLSDSASSSNASAAPLSAACTATSASAALDVARERAGLTGVGALDCPLPLRRTLPRWPSRRLAGGCVGAEPGGARGGGALTGPAEQVAVAPDAAALLCRCGAAQGGDQADRGWCVLVVVSTYAQRDTRAHPSTVGLG